MKIINLVPHDINVLDKDGNLKIIPPSGKIVRVGYTQKEIETIDNFSIYKKDYRKMEFPVNIEDGNYYIVSREVLKALQEENHPLLNRFIAPNTTKAEKDENGIILNVKGFTV